MRNSKRDLTPQSNKKDVQTEDKTSAKKLVQARLPFKVIAPETSPKAEEESKHTQSSEARKRKLSYGSNEEPNNDEEEANTSKENVDIVNAASKKKKIGTACSDAAAATDTIISLLDEDDVEISNAEDITDKDKGAKLNSTLKTPKAGKIKAGAGTPQTSSAKKDKTGSASKLQIKLPLNSGKKLKKRKSKIESANTSIANNVSVSLNESSDDIEDIASKENPQKRTKLAEENESEKNKVSINVINILFS